MSFRLVPKSVTLNDFERRNSPTFRVISPNSIALEADYVTVVENRPIMCAEYPLPRLAKLDSRSIRTVSAIAKLSP